MKPLPGSWRTASLSGSRGQGIETALAAFLRRQARRQLRQRHRRAGSGVAGAGDRSGRCGDLPYLRSRHRGGGRRNAVFADVDAATFNLDPASLGALATAKRLGLKPEDPVDLFRVPGRLRCHFGVSPRLRSDDAAQSFGADLQRPTARTLTHATATSFFPRRALGCGDGAVLTDDAIWWEKSARSWPGRRQVRQHIGLTSRLDTIQAAVLLEAENLRRRDQGGPGGEGRYEKARPTS